jgi:outer membrane biosynthesis protein TonB
MKKLVLGFFFFASLTLQAQLNATGYFNKGGKEFVHSKLEKAIATVDDGLKKFPTDAALNALRKKLEEEKKKKDQNKDKKNQEKKEKTRKNKTKEPRKKNKRKTSKKRKRKTRRIKPKKTKKKRSKKKRSSKNHSHSK